MDYLIILNEVELELLQRCLVGTLRTPHHRHGITFFRTLEAMDAETLKHEPLLSDYRKFLAVESLHVKVHEVEPITEALAHAPYRNN